MFDEEYDHDWNGGTMSTIYIATYDLFSSEGIHRIATESLTEKLGGKVSLTG